jgi:hypothetical protein
MPPDLPLGAARRARLGQSVRRRSGNMDVMQRVLRERGRAGSQLVIAIIAVMLAVVVFAGADGDDGGPMLFGLGLLTVAVAIVLWSRRGVVVDEDRVTLRNGLRNRHIPWAEVVYFGVEEIRRNGRGLRGPTPVVRLRSGEVVTLPGADPMWFPRPGGYHVVNELRRELSSRSA